MNHAPQAAAAGVDIGGTFTDAVLLGRDGMPRGVKVPTTPHDQSEGLAAGLAAAAAGDVPLVAHGTTTATNAVLERAVARTVMVTTEGFRDVLTIARQDRPSLYDLSVVRPEPLVPADLVVTVRERMAPDGSAVLPLDDDEVARVIDTVRALSPESVAVCLLFSYANPEHELRLCRELQALDVPITRSSDLLPEFREYERASTCVLDAAVAPVMRRYLGRVRDRVPDAAVTVMTSGGGVADLDAVAAAPVLTLLSGPAAGVVAAAAVASQAGFDDAVAFDMGGTSTDVCLIRGGRPEIDQAGTIGGLPFTTPSVAIHTVGAGGGSIAEVDAGGALRVGPRSAGADPGPACYGHGGTAPTVTDAHAVLGHLLADQPLGDSGLRLDVGAAEQAVRALPGFDQAAAAAADGIITVVRATMLRALRRVSTERGVDPASLALVAYGGAGPLHATALARDLGCAAAIIPPAPGVLSALGLLLAPPRRELSRTVMAQWPRSAPPPDLQPVWTDLTRQARELLPSATLSLVADCRYEGQSHELRLDVTAEQDLATTLDEAHRAAYGYDLPTEPVEVVTVRVVAQDAPALAQLPESWDLPQDDPGEATIVVSGVDCKVPVIPRGSLRAGSSVAGPALIVQPDSTALLNDGDHAEVTAGGSLVVRW